MISLGIFFAFDWGGAIAKATRAVLPENLCFWATTFQTILGSGGTGVDQNWWLFFFPSILIGICWILMFFWLKNSPGEAGYKDFDTGEGSVSSSGERLPISQVYLKIITHPILLIVCLIEFCSGILRNGIMHWYYIFAGKTGKETWITDNWGLSLLIAGFTGALLTGWCSDRFFQSRRAPMAAILYIVMLLSTLLMTFTLDLNPWYAGGAALAISMAVIGVHGILSGTSTADFAGTKNAGAATGIVDGMVYLGTGIQSFIIPLLIPSGDSEEAKVAFNYQWWPVFLIPFAIIGAGLCIKIWNALPKAKPKAA
jgi:OPA family glycerol-3-phosphate transporter-like MFS transporter